MPSDWIEALGVLDAETGATAAMAAREKILEPAERVLGSSQQITLRLVVFQGFVARAQALHEGATQMVAAENPHAAFTLLRAYAENAAAILYAKDHPNRVQDFSDTEGHGIPIGSITNYARKRFDGFKGIYDQLSKFAHPQALGLLASSSIKDTSMQWASAPHFQQAETNYLPTRGSSNSQKQPGTCSTSLRSNTSSATSRSPRHYNDVMTLDMVPISGTDG